MSTGIMQLCLGIYLLATCIALGVSLECEECIGFGKNCHGDEITCPPEKDTCAIISTESMVPHRNTTLNGKKCPACYAVGGECKDEITECAGNENFCFAMSGTTSMGNFNTKVHLKGCANEAACYEMDSGGVSAVGMNIISEAQCVSGATARTSSFFGVLYPVLTGVLFMKFFV
ncbi:hypothetical protein JD844_005762 [Phrynosoma platyrhinos]|uniref:UPAR/Ly6 domain-containing protein n=1 Tax=Phrynosoma platyrhinos TaxID=52577 RepID=A0ABQ7TPS3_PHRPL|nr:hypothetical protein JD844_005762 [Phrynosoma platyrhinos]